MPKYKKRVPEYTAIQFTGSNIREVMEELGPEFSTIYDLDIKGATDFTLKGYGFERKVDKNMWVTVDHFAGSWTLYCPDDFGAMYEPVKRVGRPPKADAAKPKGKR